MSAPGSSKRPRPRELLARLSLAEKAALLTGADRWTVPEHPGIGLRAIRCSDGAAGDTALNVPAPVALAATWDPHRAGRIGSLLAAECRRQGVDVLLGPAVSLTRGLGEDPLLTAVIGGAIVRGVQRGGVAAAVKQFAVDDSADERVQREVYLAPFETIVRQERPWAVVTESPMLRGILKDEWRFDGVVVSGRGAARGVATAGALVRAVRDGRVSESAVDDKVLRILRLASRVGALGPAAAPGAAAKWAGQRARNLLRTTAAAGFVLARNEGSLLPLDPRALRRVAVIGPNAAVTGLRAALVPNVAVSYSAGEEPHHLARAADVAVVVVGTAEEGPGRQDKLVRRVAAVNPRTVVVVNTVAPVPLPWAGEVLTILLTMFPGQEYGNALADVLLGRAEPGGRLPMTWPEPRFPFGHGLGYTSWDYLGADVALAADGIRVRVRLKNAGARYGTETIQVYASRPDSVVERPVRWLAGFAKAGADPGAEPIVEIPLPFRRLAYWDTATRAWTVEPGAYQLAVGSSSRNLPLTVTVKVP